MGNLAVTRHFLEHGREGEVPTVHPYSKAPTRTATISTPLIQMCTKERLGHVLRNVTIGGHTELFEKNLNMGMYRPDLIKQIFFKELRARYLSVM